MSATGYSLVKVVAVWDTAKVEQTEHFARCVYWLHEMPMLKTTLGASPLVPVRDESAS